MICRLGTLQASAGSCRAGDSYYLSLAGSSRVHAQIEQNRNQILSCCQLALFHCTKRVPHTARTALSWALLGLGIRRTRLFFS